MWWLNGAAVIVLFTFAPVIPLVVLTTFGLASWLTEPDGLLGMLPWLFFYTLPAGVISLAAWTVAGIVIFFVSSR